VAVDLSVSWSRPSPTVLLGLLHNALRELGVSEYCRVEVDGETLRVFVTDPDSVRIAIGGDRSQPSGLHVCPHCSYTTPYEELLREHVKLHYIGL
ncbi:MAG: hypothetical protein NZ733_05995, partial [Aigarchaeota archaeon]|nr:hypothetical protein [Aigarchaeota archaeon]